MRHYILDENKVLRMASLMEWGTFFENFDNRKVAHTYVYPPDPAGSETKRKHSKQPLFSVSTVFIGISGQLFETMVFRVGNSESIDEERSSSWDGAEKMHARVVKKWEGKV